MRATTLSWIFGLAGLASLLHLLAAVAGSVHAVPICDEWRLLPLVEKSFAGELDLADLWPNFGPHRLFFPELVLVVLARATHWSQGAEVVANVLLGCALAAVLATKARALFSRLVPAAVSGGAVAVLALSVEQWENWVWGWQVQVFLSVLATVVAFVLLDRRELALGRVLAAGASGVVASYSFASGLLVWPIGGALVLNAAGDARRRVRLLALWGVLAAVVTGLYFHGLTATLYRPSELGPLEVARRLATAFLLCLGLPVENREGAGTLLAGGAALVLPGLAALGLVRAGGARARDLGFPLALAAFSIGCAGQIAWKESFHASYGATCSRYSTLATPLWIATELLLLALAGTPRSGPTPRSGRLALGLALGLLVPIAGSQIGARRALGNWYAVNEPACAAIASGREEDLARVFSREELPRARANARALARSGLCSYRER